MFGVFRKVESILIKRMALYKATNPKGEQHVYGENLSVDNVGDTLINYLENRIIQSFHKGLSRVGKFSNSFTPVQCWCNEALSDPNEQFERKAKEIGDYFYHTMDGSSLDLLLVLYYDIERNTPGMAFLLLDQTIFSSSAVDSTAMYSTASLNEWNEDTSYWDQRIDKVIVIRNTTDITSPRQDPALLVCERNHDENSILLRKNFLECDYLLANNKKSVNYYKLLTNWVNA